MHFAGIQIDVFIIHQVNAVPVDVELAHDAHHMFAIISFDSRHNSNVV